MKLNEKQVTLLQALTKRAVNGQDKCEHDPREHPKGKVPKSPHERVYLSKPEVTWLLKVDFIKEESSSFGSTTYTLTDKGFTQGWKETRIPKLNLKKLMLHLFDLQVFHPLPSGKHKGETPIPFIWTPGSWDSKVVLVLGPNAGGKSFFRKIISMLTARKTRDDPKGGPFQIHENIALSMAGRAGGGIMSSMVYGDEGWRSTGENSAHTVITSLSTLRGRRHPVIVHWDEPDIGMSPDCSAGVGQVIREFADDLPPQVQAMFLTSHSAALVAQVAQVKATPHYVYLGDSTGPQSVQEWLTQMTNPFPTPVSPQELGDRSHARFKLIQEVLDRKKK